MEEVRTGIKICGLTRQEDIAMVNVLRPDYIGFVFAKSRRQVSEKQAAELRKKLLPGICVVGVFVNAPVQEEVKLFREKVIDMVQLHGQEDEAHIRQLRELTREQTGTAAPVIKAVSMSAEKRESGSVPECWLESEADYLLLDNGPGGTGKAFDHTLIVPEKMTKPFFLAGGICGDNAVQAIRTCRPFALDASSGVETDGVKDMEKMRQLIYAVRGYG